MNGKKFVKLKIEPDQMEQLVVFYFDWIMKNLLVPGRIETWIMLLDMEGVHIGNVKIGRLKIFIQTAQKNFRGRLFRLISINGNWLLRGLWNITLPWLDDYQK